MHTGRGTRSKEYRNKKKKEKKSKASNLGAVRVAANSTAPRASNTIVPDRAGRQAIFRDQQNRILASHPDRSKHRSRWLLKTCAFPFGAKMRFSKPEGDGKSSPRKQQKRDMHVVGF
jgi:hypothetical protein